MSDASKIYKLPVQLRSQNLAINPFIFQSFLMADLPKRSYFPSGLVYGVEQRESRLQPSGWV